MHEPQRYCYENHELNLSDATGADKELPYIPFFCSVLYSNLEGGRVLRELSSERRVHSLANEILARLPPPPLEETAKEMFPLSPFSTS